MAASWIELLLVCMLAIHSHAEDTAPVITKNPSNLVVANRSPATLICEAKGDPEPEITWFKDGKLVLVDSEDPDGRKLLMPQGSLYFLRIVHSKNKKKKSDLGNYHCEATNRAGSARSTEATIELGYIRSSFRTDPRGMAAGIGSTVTLTCVPPKSSPEAKITWLKDEMDLVLDGKRVKLQEPDELVISNLKKSDAGKYNCEAFNIAGRRLSESAEVIVNVPPKVNKGPQTSVTKLGETAVFTCQATGDPEPDILWSRVGGQLPVNRHIINGGKLVITDVQQGDSGLYECTALNSAGSDSARASLTVQSVPTFILNPKDQVVPVGENAMFQCKAKGSPDPAIFWQREGYQQLMFPDQQTVQRFTVKRDGSLIITDVQKGDEGVYTCSALSIAGSSNTQAKLLVVESARIPPMILTGPINNVVVLDQVVKFECEVEGNPDPEVSWYKAAETVPLVNSSHTIITKYDKTHTLTIRGAQFSDVAKYRCEAVSLLGKDSKSAILYVRSKTTGAPLPSLPSQASQPVVSNITSTSVVLSWKPPSNPETALTYAVKYKNLNKSGDYKVASKAVTGETVLVKSLEPSTQYVFSVIAMSKGGAGLPSVDSKVIKTLPKFLSPITIAPKTDIPSLANVKLDVSVLPVNSRSLQISWTPVRPAKRVTGFYIFWRKQGSNGPYHKETVINNQARTYTLSGLRESTKYEIKVQAYNINGINSILSDSAFLATSGYKLGVPSPHPPFSMNVNSNSSTSALVSWYSVWTDPQSRIRENDPIVYKFSFVADDKKNDLNVTVNGTGALSWVMIKGLKPGTTYKVRMVAITPSGTELKSNIKPLTTDAANEEVAVAVVEVEKDTRSPGALHEFREFARQPWFIATMGGILWIILLLMAILFYRRSRKRRNARMKKVDCSPNHLSDTSAVPGCESKASDFSNSDNRSSGGSFTYSEPKKWNDEEWLGQSTAGSVPNIKNDLSAASSDREPNLPPYESPQTSSLKRSLETADYAEITGGTLNRTRSPKSQKDKNSFIYTEMRSATLPRNIRSDVSNSGSESASKPKLKIQSFEALNGQGSMSTFHAEPPPAYDTVVGTSAHETSNKEEEDQKPDNFNEDKESVSGRTNASSEFFVPRTNLPPEPITPDNAYPSLQRRRKGLDLKPPPRLAILNWTDMLPPPPSHPPPSSVATSPPPSPPFHSSATSLCSDATGMSRPRGKKSTMSELALNNLRSPAERPSPMSGIPNAYSASYLDSDMYNSQLERQMAESVKSGRSNKKSSSKPKPIPIDLEGITSDIIMQWAESVTNTSGSDEDSSDSSSPSRISGISSDGSFFTDTDFANAVRVAAECGGFNMDAYGLVDSMGLQPYPQKWKNDKVNPYAMPRSAMSSKKKHQMRPPPLPGPGGNGPLGPGRVQLRHRPRMHSPLDNGTSAGIGLGIGESPHSSYNPRGPSVASSSGSTARRPIISRGPRANLPKAPPPPVPPPKMTQPIRVEPVSRGPVKKKYAVVRQLPNHGNINEEEIPRANSVSSSTSTASTVRSSTCPPSLYEDSDAGF